MTGSWMDLANHRSATKDELNGGVRQQLQTTKRTHSRGRAERAQVAGRQEGHLPTPGRALHRHGILAEVQQGGIGQGRPI